MEPCHIGIPLKVLSESFHMNTNVKGFGEKLKWLPFRAFVYVGFTAGILSGFFLMWMSIDRLVAVRSPMKAKTHCTTKKAMKAIVVSTVVVAVLNVHILLTYASEKNEQTGIVLLKINSKSKVYCD